MGEPTPLYDVIYSYMNSMEQNASAAHTSQFDTSSSATAQDANNMNPHMESTDTQKMQAENDPVVSDPSSVPASPQVSVNWNSGSKAKIRTTLGGRRLTAPHKPKSSSLLAVPALSQLLPHVTTDSLSSQAETKTSSYDQIMQNTDRFATAQKSSSTSAKGNHEIDVVSDDQISLVVDQDFSGLESGEVSEDNRNGDVSDSRKGDSAGNAIDLGSSEDEKDRRSPSSKRLVDQNDISDGEIVDDSQDADVEIYDPGVDVEEEEEENYDAMMDYASSSQQHRPKAAEAATQPSASLGISSSTHTSVNGNEVSGPKVLMDLLPESIEEQLRYFHIGRTPQEIPRTEPVRCLICSKSGHIDEFCPLQTCPICQTIGDHLSNSCPKNEKCTRCSSRGHTVSSCHFKLKPLPSSKTCPLCHRQGHDDDECEMFWRSSGKIFDTPLLRSQQVWCFECAAPGHLGNDCPQRPRGKRFGSSMWTERGNFSECTILPNLPPKAAPKPAQAPVRQTHKHPPRSTGNQRNSNRHPIEYVESSGDERSFIRPPIAPATRNEMRLGNISTIPNHNTYRPNYSDNSPNSATRYNAPTLPSPNRRIDTGYPRGGPGGQRYHDEYRGDYRDNYGVAYASERYDAYSGGGRRRSRSPRGGGRGGPDVYRPMPSAGDRAWRNSRS